MKNNSKNVLIYVVIGSLLGFMLINVRQEVIKHRECRDLLDIISSSQPHYYYDNGWRVAGWGQLEITPMERLTQVEDYLLECSR